MDPENLINPTCIATNVSQIKAEYFEHFQKLAENIKKDNLNKFRIDNENEEINIKLDTFKNELTESILSEFDTVWNKLDIDRSLRSIEALKMYAKNEIAWRPGGKTVFEQTKCCRIPMHKLQIAYLEKKIEQQNSLLDSLFNELQEKRQFMVNIETKRKFVKSQMNVRKQQFIESKENFKKLLLKNSLYTCDDNDEDDDDYFP